jgi:hypothetical protein
LAEVVVEVRDRAGVRLETELWLEETGVMQIFKREEALYRI